MKSTKSIAGNGVLAPARGNLQHLLEVSSTLVRASAAAIVLVRDGTSLVLQSTRPASVNATFHWQNDHAPYDLDRSHIITKVADLELSRAIRAMIGEYRTGFLVRVPIVVEPTFTVALLLHSAAQQSSPDRQTMVVLRSLARAMANDARSIASEITASRVTMAVPDTFEQVVHSVLTDNGLRLLFNPDAQLIGASRGIKAAFGTAPPESNTETYLKELPCADSLRHLFQRVLETQVSSPEVEISFSVPAGKRTVSARLNPVRPIDDDETLVEIRMNPVGWNPYELSNQQRRDIAHVVAGTAETFLMDTLLHKRSIRNRKDTSYVTVRAWRSSVKKHQIAALRMVKSNDPQFLGELAGLECASELEQLVGLGTFRYIVPMPCGHSPLEKCLSSAIARAAGARLNIPVVNAFAHLQQSGSSHPRTIATRPPMRVIQPVPGPAIIIDDVATSGAHLFEAATLLRIAGSSSFALAWIGGESP
jgi:hypothetical protein